MAVFSSPLSQENRIQIARASFSSSGIAGGRSLSIAPVVSAPPPQQDPETLRLLEDNQTALVDVSSSINNVRQSIEGLNQSLNNVSNAMYGNMALEQSKENQKAQQERILAEDALRDENEAILERKIQNTANASVQPIAQQTQRSLNSLMGLFNPLFLGWLGFGAIQNIQSLLSGNSNRFKKVGDAVENSFKYITFGLSSIKDGLTSFVGRVTSMTEDVTKVITKGIFKGLFGGLKGPEKAAAETTTEAATKTATKEVAETTTEAATKTATKEAAETTTKAATKAGTKTEAKGLSRLLPFAGAAISGAFAYQNLKEGDIIGAGLDIGGMIPGPLGWASLAGSLGYETMTGGGIKGIPNLFAPEQKKPKSSPETPENSPAPTPEIKKLSATQTSSTPPPSKAEKPEIAPKEKLIPPPPLPDTQSEFTEQQSESIETPPNQFDSLSSNVEPQTQILSSEQIKINEKKAEEVTSSTPTANFNVNFGDQISKYSTKMNETSTSNEMQDVNFTDTKSPFTSKVVSNSTISFSPFDFTPNEKDEVSYNIPSAVTPVKKNISISETVGPLPEPPPNIIVAPLTSQQKTTVRPPGSAGVANDVPNILSSNPDNFYVSYSLTQYNVVI